ncbi:nicotinate-nucleotide adenylyltransferase [Coleofasciculus sp. FACHB-129]|uniref:nicotinate-nucleotide adenylyltransferase n=1 Tax=Cyanophyceae TaxID=3028117 RepID=UPI001687BE1A|nr:nicotinate-nucleotide adenylyltransferase [Coleofasciculus sp. FACHB-129]MBD1893205.1 nicotinate-nucleotide adenylyltransferase [Coleofasciculus sp. FACHB-129]
MAHLGMIHGRFQPFHKEHLQYLLSALERCEHCVVGITNPEPSEFNEEVTSGHRHLPASNPYTYFQRAEMIRRSLIAERIEINKISFVPFHIFDTSKWYFYLPKPNSTVQYVRLFSSWERKKVGLFYAYGFQVEILDEGAVKNIEATQVRQLMEVGGDWKKLVPDGTIQVIEMIKNGLL